MVKRVTKNRTWPTITTLFAIIVTLCFVAVNIDSVQAAKSVDSDSKANDEKPITPAEIDASIVRGVAFLLQTQNSDGSWGRMFPARPTNILAPVPGGLRAFHNAVTALCVSSLIEIEAAKIEPKDESSWNSAELKTAIDRGETWILENLPKLRRCSSSVLYNTWGHAYGLEALSRMYDRKPKAKERQRQIKKVALGQLDRLKSYECIDGGWCYYDFDLKTQRPGGSSMSFVTSAVLVALADARDSIGVELPKPIIDRAIASLRRQELPDRCYLYGEYLKTMPRRGINRPAGSLGRTQSCNAALHRWNQDDITDEVIEEWLDRLVTRNGWLDIGRKRPVPHESWCQVAGYFFYFGHYYAAQCIALLPEDRQPPHQANLARLLEKLQEKDGSWWDFPLYNYHQQYGTAMAMMSLLRCRPDAE